jgi:N6-adenosine-specific RNA methylase IME4
MRDMIERVSYAPRIELFARERFDGWEAYGDELAAKAKQKNLWAEGEAS